MAFVPSGCLAAPSPQPPHVPRRRCGNLAGTIPVPDLAGALIAKSQAVEVDDFPGDQRVDLAFLYSLIKDLQVVDGSLSGGDRRLLRQRREVMSSGHQAWRALGDHAVDGHLAFVYLTRPINSP